MRRVEPTPTPPLRSGLGSLRLRVLVVAGFLLTGFVWIAVRAVELAVAHADVLQEFADEQHWRTFEQTVWRGPILDRAGGELALTVEVDSVFLNPQELEDPDRAAADLAAALGLEPRALALRLRDAKSRPHRRFLWVERLVTPAEAAAVRALKLPGVQIVKEPKRFYPGRRLASQLVGFVGYDSRGLDGLEHEYDDVLRGEARSYKGARDARGRMVFTEGLGEVEVRQDQRVELAIDRTIQFIAEQEVEAALRAFEGRAASVVVMDPHTGEVLALANGPSYDPNLYGDSTGEARRNRAVTDRYEPGSVIKIFTVAALLEAGLMGPEEQVYCENGLYMLGDYKIRDAHRNEWLTLTQCLQRSSNVCMAKISAAMGKQRLYEALRRFGFGERTGVPVPGESPGLLRHYSRWYEVDLAAVSFGQGVGVSNLQLAAAVSAIANGGMLMRPVIVRRVLGADGRVIREYPPTPRRRVVSERTARLVASMLTSVTEFGGTGTEARVPGFPTAGKTGTAQKADPVRGGYSKEHWTASFVGFVPADNPRLVISVAVDEPLVNHYGGIVAAPIFRRVAERSLRYLGIAPHRLADDDPVAASARPAAADQAGSLTVTGVPVRLPAPGLIEVPDFTGETVRAALRIARQLGLEIAVEGAGFAVEQTPPPGTGLAPGDAVRLRFDFRAGGAP